MNTREFLQALNQADDNYIQQAGVAGGHFSAEQKKRRPRVLIRVLLAAAIVMVLSATAFAAGEIIGIWNDRWLQTPKSDPVEVVREAVSRQIEKEYTVSVTVETLLPDEAEARRYYDHDPAAILYVFSGWGQRDPALEGKGPEDVAAVYARYTVEYDHTKTFYRDGTLEEYFYLVRNGEGKWEIVDTSAEQEVEYVPIPPDAPEAEDYEGARRLLEDRLDRIVNSAAQENRVEIDELYFDEARKETIISWARESALAEANGWTEAWLRNNLAVYTATLRYYKPDADEAWNTETAAYCYLWDPEAGEWYHSLLDCVLNTLVRSDELRELEAAGQ